MLDGGASADQFLLECDPIIAGWSVIQCILGKAPLSLDRGEGSHICEWCNRGEKEEQTRDSDSKGEGRVEGPSLSRDQMYQSSRFY